MKTHPFLSIQFLLGLFSYFLFSAPLKAQIIAQGVSNIARIDKQFSFMFRDSRNTLWLGHGNFLSNGKRVSNGLGFINSTVYGRNYQTGIFTDAIELDSTVYFSAYDGLFQYSGTTFLKDDSITENSCLEIHNSNLWIGTMGHGLFEKKNSSYKQVLVSVNGQTFDSIYSLKSDGMTLWIGSSRGLIKYDGTTFELYEVSLKFSKGINSHTDQKIIADIEIDKNNKLWVLTRNQEDSLECLFYLENKKLKSAIDHYKANCSNNYLIPRVSNVIELNQDGHLMVGLLWGLLIFEDKLRPMILNDNFGFNPLNYSKSAYVYRDIGNKFIVSTNYFDVLNSLDLSKFDPESIQKQLRKTFFVDQIDINEIKASIINDGNLFSNMDQIIEIEDKPTFDIPNVGCAKPIYTAGLWVGGFDEATGNLHLAAQTYRQNGSDYLPGPIDLVTGTYDSVSNRFYNRIWKIDRKTIEIFKLNHQLPSYKIPSEIIDWPAHGKGNFTQDLAPFVDLNSNGIYEPLLGEYPEIKGDQMLWWVFNDLGIHAETNSKPLGIEIHGSCYAFYHNTLVNSDSNFIINRTLFFNYKLINRSKRNYRSLYLGLFNDVDLGNYKDDLVGCDTIENVGFGYNGDNYDDLPKGFGKNPPMIICKFLNQKMTNFSSKAAPLMKRPDDYYRLLRTTALGDSNYKSIGFINQGYPCNNPYNTTNNLPGDRRFIISTNTALLNSDSSINLEFAYIFLHKPSFDFLKEGCDEPKQTLRLIQRWYDTKSFPSKPYKDLSAHTIIAGSHFELHPNPASNSLNWNSDLLNSQILEISIIDQFGRTLWTKNPMKESNSMERTIAIQTLPKGLFYLKIKTLSGSFIKKIIKE